MQNNKITLILKIIGFAILAIAGYHRFIIVKK